LSNRVSTRYIVKMNSTESTVTTLERLSALVQQAVRDDAARQGLLPIHWQVLAYLARANRYSDIPIAVAEYLGITRGTVSQTLAVLERKGLIAKEADERHGKRIHLTLTTAGEALLAQGWAERLEQVLADSGTAEAHLRNDLAALVKALQQVNGNRAFGVCRQCEHFRIEGAAHRCGLTGEPLAASQIVKICREWTSDSAAS
jgi:MarR family transcriptional regulator, negative regulator of the multidrug operon emrRAB